MNKQKRLICFQSFDFLVDRTDEVVKGKPSYIRKHDVTTSILSKLKTQQRRPL